MHKKIVWMAVITWWAFVGSGCGAQNSPPGISVQPQSVSVASGTVAVFSVIANGTGALSYQWSKNGTVISDSNSATYLTAPVTSADNGAAYTVQVSNSFGKVTSKPAVLSLVQTPNVSVLTYHNDPARSGQNAAEVRLTPANVTQAHFHKIGIFPTDGKMYAQPLVVADLAIGGVVRNVLYAATEHDSVYAFDADTGTQLWKVSLLPSGSGETPSSSRNCAFITPEIGVTATPVVDATRGVIYVVAASMDATGASFYLRLHALSLTTGAEMFGGPTTVPATFPGMNQTFDPPQYLERAALLLANGRIYTSWTSHCDTVPYSAWVITFDASTLQVSQVFNGEMGVSSGQGSFWNSGSGPAADAAGNVYLLSANGIFDGVLDADGFPRDGDFGNSFIKLAPPVTGANTLSVLDYFTMFNSTTESAGDQDLGSGGGMLLPDFIDDGGTVRHLMVGAGKDNQIYLVDRDNMGKFNQTDNSQIWQNLTKPFPSAQYGVFGAPAYFNSYIYYGAIADAISAFQIVNAKLSASAVSRTANTFPYPGAAISISANGLQNGIVWAAENSKTQGVLHAYDATDLSNELYNSNQAGSRDSYGTGSYAVPPTVANGKVYVVTQVDLTDNPSGLQEGVVAFGAF